MISNENGDEPMILDKIREFDIPVVDTIKSTDSIEKFVEYTRNLVGMEGFIISFSDGHKIKIKADQYVRIHKVKDMIRTERHILHIIMNEEIDDLIPILDETDVKTVRDYEKRFEDALQNVMGRIEGLIMIAKTLHGGDKKDVAINFVPNLIHKQDARFIFSAFDGKELRPLILDHVRKSVTKTEKYEELAKWMEMKE